MKPTDSFTICIPTYDRPRFLEWTLHRTRFDFKYAQIVVTDNSEQPDVREYNRDLCDKYGARYIQNATNIGPFPNLAKALLEANTEFCCYLGDDDYLLWEQVEERINWMRQNRSVVACYAPCQLWDEHEQKSVFEAFYVANGPQTFSNGLEGKTALWNFLHAHHVWPEHAIYRREYLERILADRGPAYWCFTDLANAINTGPVHFHDKPYYRNLCGHPVGERRKLGDEQCLTEFDAYRAGLEVLAYDLFSGMPLPDLAVQNINMMIRHFIWVRLEVASRMLESQGRHVEATQLKKRHAVTKVLTLKK